ncbi:MAG: ABC transporter permease [Candidatus Synoicihabitans palmerolidicus]|nr:ABC transporter permease [Candidatus Synoicihabitans palmerolidicus]MCC5025383.1 ABC transporter permease [Candidatus Synoicihabitans palmerolidicus]
MMASLVVCIGPNAVVFSALQALVLKPLPFVAPDQLVTVRNVAAGNGGQFLDSSTTQSIDFAAHADLFAGFAGLRKQGVTVNDFHAASRALVSPNFFALFARSPVQGRFFTVADVEPGQNHIIVLSHAYWESHYQAASDVIGHTIRLND